MPKILQLTDLHVFADPEERLRGVPTRETLRQVIEHARGQGDYDRVLITGDFTHDERRETYAAVREMLGDWMPNCRVVPGNHDDRDRMREVFGDIVPASGPICFADQLDRWKLIGLDTHVPGEVPGAIDSDHVDWLRQEIASATGPVAVCLHHPPVSVNSPWMDRIGLRQPEALVDVLGQSDAVKLILGGHVHHEFHTKIGSADYFTTPATALQFEPDSEQPAYANDAPGYRVVRIDGDEFETEVFRLPTTEFPPDPAD